MKKKTYLGLVNAGGMGFALQAGQEVELDGETAADLMRAAYVWPMKKGLTLAEAQGLAGEHRANILAEQEAAAAEDDPDAADPAADPAEDDPAAAAPDAETQNATPAE